MRVVLAVLICTISVLSSSIDECHFHSEDYFCLDEDGNEGYIDPVPSKTSGVPTSYTSCHNHGTETFCLNGDDEVQFVVIETGDVLHSDEESASVSLSTSATSSESYESGHGAEETQSSGNETVVNGCHSHGSSYFCVNDDGEEGTIIPTPSEDEAPESYTSCHNHGTETFCMNGDEEVQFVVEAASTSNSESSTSESTSSENCHFHAGVEHCVGSTNAEVESQCSRVDRDYDIPLRIGLIFAMLAVSAIGSFAPLFISSVLKIKPNSMIFVIIRQFGTGVIISTCFVHLLTHSQLMFANECLTNLQYEATAGSIAMAGLFIAFLIDYFCKRLVSGRADSITKKSSETDHEELKDQDSASAPGSMEVSADDKVSVMLLEAGIVFHSILIGITLVVAANSYFITLFIVIVFHQFFEGLALASRIADLTDISIWSKIAMASIFAIITPIGMAIGTGVLHKFNGNDPSTIIALGTLDALSAGILLWVGIIEMFAHDWLRGSLSQASFLNTAGAMVSLVAGMALMSLLGKWA